MIKRITQISFTIILLFLLVSCKNTKQKIQEHVNTYNNTAALFEGENIRGTTAKGFLADNKIELRIETDLEQNQSNKLVSNQVFPKFLAEMIKSDRISKDLIDEGVIFDVYFLASNNTILNQKLIDKEGLVELTKK
ncbi:hypothetical protein [Flavobacterium piscis]|uniref:Lipoprotein n=1 Tax=Flavobacterium piscis TaxID=1114874 RepID=A0ABU1Y8K2_9FLAO|nr:hypothetical protein [Flavobacterium piscis]MDR7210549.1 hypothetical protein [Flavobacterium piscis]